MLWRTLQFSDFTVHLKYDTVSMLRRRNLRIMEYAMNKGNTKNELLSISRVRGLLCAIFMSDIVKADITHLEDFATVRSPNREHTSKYEFPKETPTPGDWTMWIQFWRQNTVGNFKLATQLGELVNPTHRVWEWYYDQERSSLQERTPNKK
jgi:hypothetical protein